MMSNHSFKQDLSKKKFQKTKKTDELKFTSGDNVFTRGEQLVTENNGNNDENGTQIEVKR
jgi:hypothetical protein